MSSFRSRNRPIPTVSCIFFTWNRLPPRRVALLTGPPFAAATAQGTFLVAGFSVSFIIVFLDITSCGSDGICRDAIHGRNKPPRTHRCPGRFCVFHMPRSEGEGIPHQRAVDHLIVLQNTLGHLRPIRRREGVSMRVMASDMMRHSSPSGVWGRSDSTTVR